ncbi:NAD-dependent epimerase [Aminipila luticellarii]|uniref:NAD-dependent epimerase n=1 Tax=Aminipila luticellarii TaxID=2507160 RepID=A0A410PSN1_9FIRM|nr:NAD-dependent epimerase [Aminipila luticellarii]QAT41899.1 NAD-dependent epimerase [Aminipila luticellarii]
MKVFVSGAAGFIGFNLSLRLISEGYDVIGYDNLNDYYDVNLKKDRLKVLEQKDKFVFVRGTLENKELLEYIFQQEKPDYVVNLAAQAGVRYSLDNPRAYIDSNIVGFLNILECCRNFTVKHLVFASSSSVYGGNKSLPFSTSDNVDHPISLYAATKKSNELMAHTYSHLFDIPCTGLRFFTVYGPWGRPDMALFLFTKAIDQNQPIKVFNYGKMIRDFTYIDDIVEGVFRVMKHIPKKMLDADERGDTGSSTVAPYKIYNIGNNNPVELEHYIEVIEKCLGRKAIKEYLPLQAGDVPATYAQVDDLMRDVGFKPETSVEEGISKFIDWYKEYYK